MGHFHVSTLQVILLLIINMSFSKQTNSGSIFGEQSRRFEQFFEIQLLAIGLADDQLKAQSPSELRDSLETLNDAIRNPSSFGTLHLRLDTKVGLVVTSVGAESHIEVGALPLLLKKKKYVLERIRLLETSESIDNLKEELAEETNLQKQKTLEEKIADIEAKVKSSIERSESLSKIDLSESLEEAAKRAAIATETFERKARVWQDILARESVATLIGAFLVLVITGVLLFRGTGVPSVITNAYLVVIGFFFGQASQKNQNSLKAGNAANGGEQT